MIRIVLQNEDGSTHVFPEGTKGFFYDKHGITDRIEVNFLPDNSTCRIDIRGDTQEYEWITNEHPREGDSDVIIKKKKSTSPFNTPNSDPAPAKDLPSEDDTFTMIGQLLASSQYVERVVSRLIGIVYPKGVASWNEIEELEMKPLGELLNSLRKRVEIDPAFDGLLLEFKNQRNMFVHRLSAQPWFDPRTEAGRVEVWKFLKTYQKLNYEVLFVGLAALFKHAKATGMPETKFHDELNRSGMIDLINEFEGKSQVAFRGVKSSQPGSK